MTIDPEIVAHAADAAALAADRQADRAVMINDVRHCLNEIETAIDASMRIRLLNLVDRARRMTLSAAEADTLHRGIVRLLDDRADDRRRPLMAQCPRCGGPMQQAPGGGWLCPNCGTTR